MAVMFTIVAIGGGSSLGQAWPILVGSLLAQYLLYLRDGHNLSKKFYPPKDSS
ncbi:MAG: hypothetical protein ABL996_17610 [Micropepsaceae bacterium]